MKRINLRELYPFYDNDFFLEVSDTVAELLKLLKRKDHADYERRRVHRAYYSLDADDGIKRDVILLVGGDLYRGGNIRASAEKFHEAVSEAV